MGLVREVTGAHPALVEMFFAHGALISIATAIGMEARQRCELDQQMGEPYRASASESWTWS